MFAGLIEGLISSRDRLRAVAVTAAVSLDGAGKTAIKIDLEHRDASAFAIVVPYKTKAFGKELKLGEMALYPGSRATWSQA
jgi:hypothetical protein